MIHSFNGLHVVNIPLHSVPNFHFQAWIHDNLVQEITDGKTRCNLQVPKTAINVDRLARGLSKEETADARFYSMADLDLGLEEMNADKVFALPFIPNARIPQQPYYFENMARRDHLIKVPLLHGFFLSIQHHSSDPNQVIALHGWDVMRQLCATELKSLVTTPSTIDIPAAKKSQIHAIEGLIIIFFLRRQTDLSRTVDRTGKNFQSLLCTVLWLLIRKKR
jgi:hypothetical protein